MISSKVPQRIPAVTLAVLLVARVRRTERVQGRVVCFTDDILAQLIETVACVRWLERVFFHVVNRLPERFSDDDLRKRVAIS